jgi:hypothetical protein
MILPCGSDVLLSPKTLFIIDVQFTSVVAMREGISTVLAVLVILSMIQIEFPHYYAVVEGQISIDAGYSDTIEVACNQGDVIRGWFSAEHSKVELIVIHSEDYASSGLDDESTFLYDVYQISYSLQFTSVRGGTWNFVFVDNTSTQEIAFRFEIWSEEDLYSLSMIQIAIVLTVITVAVVGVYKLWPRIRKRRDLASSITGPGELASNSLEHISSWQ